MLPKLQYFATHWKNGMKVTEGHLNNEQNFFADQLRDRLALERTSFNHGLLPCSPGQTSLEIEINSEWIEVSQCRAITIGGARIEIWPNEAQELRMPIRQLIGSQSVPEHSAWYVVLKVNPFDHVPRGLANALDAPLRHPYTRPKYALDVIAADRVNAADFGSFHVPVAKIQGSSGGIRVVEKYIPPCTRADSHPDVMQYYRRFGSMLHDIQTNVFAVTKNLVRQQREEVQLNSLAQDIRLLMEHIAAFVASQLDHYRLLVGQLPPLYIVEFFVRLARTVDSALQFLFDREQFYEYCRMYLALSPTEWGLPIVYLQYNHLEIKDSLDQIQSFLEMLSDQFLKKLSQHQYYTLTPKKTDDRDVVQGTRLLNGTDLARGNENAGSRKGSKWGFNLK
jgi:hypothetical protein